MSSYINILPDLLLKALYLANKYGIEDALWSVNIMCEDTSKYGYWNEVFWNLVNLERRST